MARETRTPSSTLKLGVVCAALVVAVLAVYSRAARDSFVDYDDPVYVTANPHVRAGPTAETLAWALTTGSHANWQPLTWISHAVDWRLFGEKPGRHHMVSVAFHAADAALLLLALFLMTGALWRSAAVAALFALHPLHVESVVWISERKDVLSTFFLMLVLVTYAFHARRPRRATRFLVPVLMALGLAAKPMLVTLPFVLLLLDAWPLRRYDVARGLPPRSLVVEKIPLFALSAASSVITWTVQQRGGAMTSSEVLPFAARLANALVSYVTYLGRMVWPTKLGVLYPIDFSIPPWKELAAIAILAALTGAAVAARRRAPYLLTGWLWYLGTLVPVIGLVQVGVQSSADRYTYVPAIGIFLAVAWGLADLFGRASVGKAALATVAALALAACSIQTWRQIGYWKDSIALFTHTLEVTSGNYVIENNLGGALLRAGRTDEAIAHFEAARRIRPDYASALSNLGLARQNQGRLGEAIALYRQALKADRDHVEAWLNLGHALGMEGDWNGAIAALRQAKWRRPDEPGIDAMIRAYLENKRKAEGAPGAAPAASPVAAASYRKGNEARDRGRLDEAEAAYREAIRLAPDFTAPRVNLGILLAMKGDPAGAEAQFDEVLRLDPNDATTRYNLGALLARQGRLPEAAAQFEAVLRIRPNDERAKRALEAARAAER